MNFSQDLQQIGLTEKESSVYLAALEMGENPVHVIAQKAGVNRATAYFVLESLMEKGLCATVTRGKKVFYMANSPEYLDSVFTLKKKEIEEQQKKFKKILPELRLLSGKHSDQPTVKLFEGLDGVKNCLVEFTPEKAGVTDEPIRLVYNRDLLVQAFSPSERDKLRSIRLKKNVKIKSLFTLKEGDHPTTVTSERKRIDGEQYPISFDMEVYKDKLMISVYGKKVFAFLVRDKSIAESMKSLFELAWKGADKK